VAAVRDAVGPGVELRLDVNGAWDLATAARALRELAPFELEYVEQPFPVGTPPDAVAGLRWAADVPIAADESVTDPGTARFLIANGAVDAMVVKPARVGGLRASWRIAEVAAAAGVPVVVSTLFETGVGIRAGLELAAALPGEQRAHGLATGGLLESTLVDDRLAGGPRWPDAGAAPSSARRRRRAGSRRRGAVSRLVIRTIPEWLQTWAAERPAAPAVADAGVAWTYAELEVITRRGAAALLAAGVRRGTRVGLLAEDTAATVAAIHAVRRAGVVLVACNRRAADAELAAQLARARVRFVLADAPHADRAATIATRDTEVVALPGIVGGAGDAAPLVSRRHRSRRRSSWTRPPRSSSPRARPASPRPPC
jgi:hypothetical protein